MSHATAPPSGSDKIRLEPSRGFGSLGLAELWSYRDLLRFHIFRNIKAKYRQMALGPIWIILQPLINMFVFTIIFGKMAKLTDDGIPYRVMTFAGIVPWLLFESATTQSSNSLVSHMNIISKVYFPRLIIPLSATLSRLVDFCLAFGVLIVLMLLHGITPGWKIVFVPVYVLLLLVTSLSVGLWTAALTVRFRDVNLLMNYGMKVFMFLSPVAYSASAVTEEWLWLYQLNPLYWIIEGFRWSLLGGSHGPTPAMVVPFLVIGAMFVTGAYVFRRAERTVVDLL